MTPNEFITEHGMIAAKAIAFGQRLSGHQWDIAYGYGLSCLKNMVELEIPMVILSLPDDTTLQGVTAGGHYTALSNDWKTRYKYDMTAQKWNKETFSSDPLKDMISAILAAYTTLELDQYPNSALTNQFIYDLQELLSQPLVGHLKARHLDVELHQPVIDNENGIATFYLWNLSGQLVGYQQYKPLAAKKKSNDPRDGRYFTYITKGTLAVWGVESLHLTPRKVFLTEGIFDAARLIKAGYSAIASLSNNPTPDLVNWLSSQFDEVIAVVDNDAAGRKLEKFGTKVAHTIAHDIGDCTEEEFADFIKQYG